MTLEPWMFGSVLIPVIATAVAWGDHRRQQAASRERQDERHAQNQAAMGAIREDVKEVRDDVKEVRSDVQRINGQVQANKAKLEDHASEIRRLRDQ